MTDYISREVVKLLCDDIIRKLDELWGCAEPEFTYGDYADLHDLVCAVKYISPADVKPVVRGEWYWDNYYYDWTCSVCRRTADNYIADKNNPYKVPNFDYCPHCGADMRKEKRDER